MLNPKKIFVPVSSISVIAGILFYNDYFAKQSVYD